MTKKEIIKFLDKEVGLFTITKDENSLGELYITSMQFKKLESLIKALKDKKKASDNLIKSIKKEIKRKNPTYVIVNDLTIEDKYINLDGSLFLLDGQIFFSGNTIMQNQSLKN